MVGLLAKRLAFLKAGTHPYDAKRHLVLLVP